MSRGMTGAATLAVLGESVRRTVACALEFDSATVRLCGAPYSIVLGGEEFLGVGQLGSIGATEEGADLAAYSMTLALAGIPRDSVAAALTEPYQNRRATVWDVPLDDNWQPIADPVVIFRGRMDQMKIQLGAHATVQITLQNRLADWERPRIQRFSDEEQQRRYPTDLGLSFAASMETREITWPASGWFKANVK